MSDDSVEKLESAMAETRAQQNQLKSIDGKVSIMSRRQAEEVYEIAYWACFCRSSEFQESEKARKEEILKRLEYE